jgi:hypothetical protein
VSLPPTRWLLVATALAALASASLTACDTRSRCTGLASYMDVERHGQVVPSWERTHHDCGDGEVCTMVDGAPRCVSWWRAAVRSPWAWAALAAVVLVGFTLARWLWRRRRVVPAPVDQWRDGRDG